MRADVFRARARNYPSAREAALFSDDVPPAVYDNLIATVRANLAPLFRYLGLRRRVLKLEEIHHYDTYVPMVPDIETRTSFDEAIEKVIEALAPLGDEYTGPGRGPARSAGATVTRARASAAAPFRPVATATRRHHDELQGGRFFRCLYAGARGGPFHAFVVFPAEPEFQDYDYPIFLAEVASTFNEELLTHHLLEDTSDPGCALPDQPPDRRHPRHGLPADDVRGVRKAHPCDGGSAARR